MAFSSACSSSIAAEINVTPLIDVLLVLLIIFMVIVPVVPHGLDSSIPQRHSSSFAILGPTTVEIFSAKAGGPLHYRVNAHETAAAELRPALRQVFATRQDHTLVVRAERGLTYGEVASAVGEGRAAGAEAVVLQDSRSIGQQH